MQFKIGSFLAFKQEMARIGEPLGITEDAPHGSISGIPITLCPNVPEDMMVVLNPDGSINSVIQFGEKDAKEA